MDELSNVYQFSVRTGLILIKYMSKLSNIFQLYIVGVYGLVCYIYFTINIISIPGQTEGAFSASC